MRVTRGYVEANLLSVFCRLAHIPSEGCDMVEAMRENTPPPTHDEMERARSVLNVHNKRERLGFRYTKTCPECEKNFPTNSKKQQYCTIKCRSAQNKRKYNVNRKIKPAHYQQLKGDRNAALSQFIQGVQAGHTINIKSIPKFRGRLKSSERAHYEEAKATFRREKLKLAKFRRLLRSKATTPDESPTND